MKIPLPLEFQLMDACAVNTQSGAIIMKTGEHISHLPKTRKFCIPQTCMGIRLITTLCHMCCRLYGDCF